MIKYFSLLVFFISTVITSCNSQKTMNTSSQNQETEQNNSDSEIIIQKQIEQYGYKNPEISYNKKKSYALCIDKTQGNPLASRIDFFIYDLIENIVVEKNTVIGNIYWENDYTIVLAPYVGTIPKKDLTDPPLKSPMKKIELKRH